MFVTFVDILSGILLVSILYMLYCFVANHLATNKIDQCIDEIEELVSPYKFCCFVEYDAAPCEMTYGLSCDKSGSISSRNMLKLLRKIKRGEYSPDSLYALCMKRQKLFENRQCKSL